MKPEMWPPYRWARLQNRWVRQMKPKISPPYRWARQSKNGKVAKIQVSKTEWETRRNLRAGILNTKTYQAQGFIQCRLLPILGLTGDLILFMSATSWFTSTSIHQGRQDNTIQRTVNNETSWRTTLGWRAKAQNTLGGSKTDDCKHECKHFKEKGMK